MHDDLVVHKGYRPAVDSKWPKAFGELMKRCWTSKTPKRPDFAEIMEVISEETLRMSPDDEICLDLDISRRSAGNS